MFDKPDEYEKLKIMTDCANMGFWELMKEGPSCTIHLDELTSTFFGYARGKRTLDLSALLERCHKDDRAHIKSELEELMQKPGTRKMIEHRVWNDTARQWYWVRSFGVSRETHAPATAYIIGSTQDIHDSLAIKTYVEQIDAANERARIMLDATPLCCSFWNENYSIIDCNEKAVELFGFKTKQEYLLRFRELYPEYQPCGRRSDELAREYLARAFEEGKLAFEWMHQSIDGTSIPAEVTLVRVKRNDSYIVTGYIRDLREHYKMMQEIGSKSALLGMVNNVAEILLESEVDEFDENIQRCMSLMAHMTDADRVYIWKNYEKDGELYCTQIYEWSAQAITQQVAKTAMETPYSVMGDWQEKLSKGQAINYLVRDLSTSEQKEMLPQGTLSILTVPVFLRDEFWGLVGFDNCHSERVYTDEEEAILRSASLLIAHALLRNEMTLSIRTAVEEARAASSAKSSFLSNMSHEMRTPMNAIIGMTAIGKSAVDIEHKDYAFGKIENASKHLLGVINDILDMSKIEANKFELSMAEFNLERLMRQVVNVISFRVDEKHQQFSVRIDSALPRTLIGDDQRLAQVITNLLSNAVKFTPENGLISLNTSLIEENDGCCVIQIEVKDSGIGIAHEHQERLFEAFTQAESNTARKFGGTGLGLAISKNIVEMMGGRLWVESEPGKGSTFAFTIRAERGSETTRQLCADGVNMSNIRVLVVDDDPVILEYFMEITNAGGIACDVAISGEQALRLIEQADGYDVYFIDWKMPDMDGIQLTHRIKSDSNGRGNQVVIMISGVDFDTIRKDAKEAGVDKFLQKPLFPSDIVNGISEYVGVTKTADYTETREQDDDFEGYTVLVAEDVEINREILMALLEPTGITVECAENGDEAVQMFKEAPERYTMIFMDVQMPVMDGYEATRVIRALPDNPKAQQIPIIAMTANVFREDIEQCLRSGMNGHLGKPLDIENVLAVLREHLH